MSTYFAFSGIDFIGFWFLDVLFIYDQCCKEVIENCQSQTNSASISSDDAMRITKKY